MMPVSPSDLLNCCAQAKTFFTITSGGASPQPSRLCPDRGQQGPKISAAMGMILGSAKLSLSDSRHLTAEGLAGKLERGQLNFNIKG